MGRLLPLDRVDWWLLLSIPSLAVTQGFIATFWISLFLGDVTGAHFANEQNYGWY